MANQSLTTTTIAPSPSPLEIRRRGAESSLSRSARSLGDAARAFREASDAQHDADELARAVALVEAALDDLAAGAELAAYAAMEGSRRRRAGAGEGLPLATARAVSWRLHGLRSGLVGARRICSDLAGVLDGAARR